MGHKQENTTWSLVLDNVDQMDPAWSSQRFAFKRLSWILKVGSFTFLTGSPTHLV